MKRWLHRSDIMIIDGSIPPKLKKDLLPTIGVEKEIVVITSYQSLSQNEGYFLNHWDAMIIDEAHYIRNPETKRGKTCFKVGGKALHRYALTGTVTVKDARDLYSSLHFLYPERFKGKWEFMERYMKKEYDWFSREYRPGKEIDPSKKEEVQEILSVIGVNRKRKEVMKWLPAKEYQVVPIPMSKPQLEAYTHVKNFFEYDKKGIEIYCKGVLDQLVRLNQISLTLDLFGENLKFGSPKMDWIYNWLEENPEEPVIIFSRSTKFLKKILHKNLVDKGYSTELITGEVSSKNRDTIIKRFQAGEIQIICGNIQALNVAVSLDRAEVAIFADREYTPALNEQAEDRIVPISEERNHPMTIYSLCSIGSYDETIEKLLRMRKNITEIINSGGIQALEREMKRLEQAENNDSRANPVGKMAESAK